MAARQKYVPTISNAEFLKLAPIPVVVDGHRLWLTPVEFKKGSVGFRLQGGILEYRIPGTEVDVRLFVNSQNFATHINSGPQTDEEAEEPKVAA